MFTTNPELEDIWSIKNVIDPTKTKRGSNLKAIWNCPVCGGEYEMSICNKAKALGCPYCSGHRVLKGFNDLATYSPEVVVDWNYEKNAPLSPDDVTKGSSKKVWWKCHICSHEWLSSVYNRGMLKRECPMCKKHRL